MKSIKNLNIYTIVENMVGGKGWGSWGLSFFLEIEDANGNNKNVLFDAGGDKEVFMHNIKAFNIDLSNIDAIFLSHGHWDHSSAILEVVKASGGVKLFTHPEVFSHRFHVNIEGGKRENGIQKEINVARIEDLGGEINFNSKPVEIIPGLWTTGEVERISGFETAISLGENDKLVKIIDGKEIEDNIMDDQSLWAEIEGIGPIILTGCAHAGLINIIEKIKKLSNFQKFYGLIGGTHLVGRSDDYIKKTIQGLKSHEFKLLSPCHCTGFKATCVLYNNFQKEFHLNYCGRKFDIGNIKIEDQIF
ncbi:MAG: MBL fold metallo-hydrolase [Candidatus Lokiarchaeota archaeon]|nr:MBL fold metallo-hydrolase [Candidatus Lokiarchaeota archaeon]